MVAGVHLVISSKVLRPGETACMKMSQQKIRRWRPRHTVGIPQKTMIAKPGSPLACLRVPRVGGYVGFPIAPWQQARLGPVSPRGRDGGMRQGVLDALPPPLAE